MRPSELRNLTVLDHPIVADKVARLRDLQTPPGQFRALVEDLSICLVYEASRHLDTRAVTVETPLESCEGRRLDRPILLVPILRAGLGMANGISRLLPEADIGMIGMYRDHDTLEPVDYYLRLPEEMGERTVYLLDPMLATGGSAVAAIDKLQSHGARDITMLALISAPEGVAQVNGAHPEIPIVTAALDRQLNDIGYILPGLGDAGDRYFGV